MREYNPLSSAALLLSTGCTQCTLVYLLTLNSGTPGPYYPLILLPYGILLFAADRLFLRRERTVMGLVLLNGALCAAVFLSILLLGGADDLTDGVIAGAFCLWLAGRAGQLTQRSPTLLELILSTDLSLVLLAVFIAFLSAVELPVSWCLPITVGCASSILGTIVYRSGAGLGPRSWVFLGGTFVSVLALVWLLVSFVAAPAGEGLVTLWNWLVAATLFMLKLLWKLLVLLSSLFPAEEGGEFQYPSGSQIVLPAEEQVQGGSLIPILLLLAAAAALILLAVVVLRKLGRLRLPAAHVRSGRSVVRRRISLLTGFRRLLAGWGRRIALCLWLWQNRNTAKGLYFLLVRRCAPMPWHKLSGETPREFLSRLRDRAAGDPELTSALTDLIPAVDRALFAPGETNGFVPQARLIRHQLGSAVRRGLIRDGLSSVRTGLHSLREGASK